MSATCASTPDATAFRSSRLFNLERGGHRQPNEKDLKGYADAFMEAFDIAARAGRRFYYSGARIGVVAPSFCTAPFRALIVTPGGKVVTCYEITSDAHPLASISEIGQVSDGKLALDTAARDNLHRLLRERRAACRDCFCYWSCAGDCYSQSFEASPEGHLVFSSRCDMNRLIMENLLLWHIEQGDGVWNMRQIQAANCLER